jgi:hypothetical protein
MTVPERKLPGPGNHAETNGALLTGKWSEDSMA